MQSAPEADLEGLLEVLGSHNVEFIVVGGAAAVLQGVPITTFDLDIVHRRTAANVDRLLAALHLLEAFVRDLAGRQRRPSVSHLLGNGHINLRTKLGPLDLFCQLGDGRGYEELTSATNLVQDRNLRARVLDLATLVEIKSAAGRSKDQLALPLILATLEEPASAEDANRDS